MLFNHAAATSSPLLTPNDSTVSELDQLWTPSAKSVTSGDSMLPAGKATASTYHDNIHSTASCTLEVVSDTD